MSNLYRAPIDVPDNDQKRETVLYGPRGEALLIREPRPIGFRHPETTGRRPTPEQPDPTGPREVGAPVERTEVVDRSAP